MLTDRSKNLKNVHGVTIVLVLLPHFPPWGLRVCNYRLRGTLLPGACVIDFFLPLASILWLKVEDKNTISMTKEFNWCAFEAPPPFFLICKNKTQGQGCFELSRVSIGSLTRRECWILGHTCFWVQRKKDAKLSEEAPSGFRSAGGQDDSVVFWVGSLSCTGRKMSFTLKTWDMKLLLFYFCFCRVPKMI